MLGNGMNEVRWSPLISLGMQLFSGSGLGRKGCISGQNFCQKTKIPEYLPKNIKQYVEVTLCLHHNSGNKTVNLNMKIQVARKRLNVDINRRNPHLFLQQMQ